MATDDVKYKSYGGRGGIRRDRDRDPLSNFASSASYLPGYESRHNFSLGSSAHSKYGGYDSYDGYGSSLPASLPRSYSSKYLDSQYRLHRTPGKYQHFSSSSLEPRSIFSSRFDPKASYISDMESREFGSHVDLIQSLQLRSSLTDGHSQPGLLSNNARKSHTTDFLLKSDLQLSLDNPLLSPETFNVSSEYRPRDLKS